MPKKRITQIALLALTATFCGVGIRWFVDFRSETAATNCVDTLRAIDSAKQQWAMSVIVSKTKNVHWRDVEEYQAIVQSNSVTNTVPTWDDLRPFLETLPVVWQEGRLPYCPRGGIYTLGRVADAPTCSHPGHVLK